ncbi:MAG: hypothetical protein FWE80_03995 [Oscillospiraceae bacterium]|nr:hypothetical protein [Oscillospiraceae bacterium]
MKKKFVAIAVMVLMVSCFTLPASAHEFSPERYFQLLVKNGSNSMPNINFTYNITKFTANTTFQARALESINNWASAVAAIKPAVINEPNASTAKAIFSDNWPNTFDPTKPGVAVSAPLITSTIYTYKSGWGTPKTASSVQMISQTAIYANRVLLLNLGYSDNDLRHNYAHEIGHALGFTEANDGTLSIMKQGRGSTFGWADYWKPRTHDVSDMTTKYQLKLWS